MAKLEIEIDDVLLQSIEMFGSKIVRLGVPRQGDSILPNISEQVTVRGVCPFVYYLIVEPKWQPPDFLQPGWVYSNNGKEWWHSTDKPTPQESRYSGTATMISRLLVKFDPPHWTDWRSSLHQIH